MINLEDIVGRVNFIGKEVFKRTKETIKDIYKNLTYLNEAMKWSNDFTRQTIDLKQDIKTYDWGVKCIKENRASYDSILMEKMRNFYNDNLIRIRNSIEDLAKSDLLMDNQRIQLGRIMGEYQGLVHDFVYLFRERPERYRISTGVRKILSGEIYQDK